MDHLLLLCFIPNVMLQFITNIISFLKRVRDSWGMFLLFCCLLEIEGKYVFFKNGDYKMHCIQWSIRNCSLLGQDYKTLKYYKENLIIRNMSFLPPVDSAPKMRNEVWERRDLHRGAHLNWVLIYLFWSKRRKTHLGCPLPEFPDLSLAQWYTRILSLGSR